MYTKIHDPVYARRSHNGIMLTGVCRQGQLPQDLDKPLKTRENRRIRLSSDERNMLPNIPNS